MNNLWNPISDLVDGMRGSLKLHVPWFDHDKELVIYGSSDRQSLHFVHDQWRRFRAFRAGHAWSVYFQLYQNLIITKPKK